MKQIVPWLALLALLAGVARAEDQRIITVYGAPDGTYATIRLEESAIVEARGAALVYLSPNARCSADEAPHYGCGTADGQPYALQFQLQPGAVVIVRRGLETIARWPDELPAPTPLPTRPPPTPDYPARVVLIWVVNGA